MFFNCFFKTMFLKQELISFKFYLIHSGTIHFLQTIEKSFYLMILKAKKRPQQSCKISGLFSISTMILSRQAIKGDQK